MEDGGGERDLASERERERERKKVRKRRREPALADVDSHVASDKFFHRPRQHMCGVTAHVTVDLDNSKGGSGFGRFSKGHDVR